MQRTEQDSLKLDIPEIQFDLFLPRRFLRRSRDEFEVALERKLKRAKIIIIALINFRLRRSHLKVKEA